MVTSMMIILAGVVIGLEENVVRANESVGTRELCARIFTGMIMRNVEVNVVYEDRTALGTCVIIVQSYNISIRIISL